MLNEKQKLAAELALGDDQIVFITGGPGTGKTYTVNDVINFAISSGKYSDIVAVAPSHSAKAILRANISNENVHTATVQSFFFFVPKLIDGKEIFSWTGRMPAEPDMLIIDEASMLSQEIWNIAKRLKCKIVLLGDKNQFKAVAAVEADILSYPQVQLTEQMRLEKKGTALADIIERFRVAVETKSVADLSGLEFDDTLVKVTDKKEWLQEVALDRTRVVLSSTNASVDSYNKYIKEAHGGEHFEVGDHMVLQQPWWVKYDKSESADLQNGDIIVLTKVEPLYDGYMKVSFRLTNGDYDYSSVMSTDRLIHAGKIKGLASNARQKLISWQDYYIFKNEVLATKHVHSMTAWKSQGSTFSELLIDVKAMIQILTWRGTEAEKLDMYNRAMYVSFSRAKRKAIIYL